MGRWATLELWPTTVTPSMVMENQQFKLLRKKSSQEIINSYQHMVE